MSEVVYNEDLVKTGNNKYLAVNVIAKRARNIVDTNGPFTSPHTRGTQKPVAIATQELIEGKLRFEKTEVKTPIPRTPQLFRDPDEDEIYEEEILERPHDPEEEEPEEGL